MRDASLIPGRQLDSQVLPWVRFRDLHWAVHYFRPFLLAAVVFTPLVGFSQHVFLAQDVDKKFPVVGASEASPIILRDGKEKLINAVGYALPAGGEYLPAYVSIKKLNLSIAPAAEDNSTETNKEVFITGTFESRYNLKEVFLVMLVNCKENQKSLVLFEVGDLKDGKSRSIEFHTSLSMDNLLGQYEAFVFSKGREVFSSKMSPEFIDDALDKIVLKKTKGVQDASAKPLMGPMPEYPKSLAGQRVDGNAKVKFTIDAKGLVKNPELVEASAPEFGVAALETIRIWRFIPKIKGGVPVESIAVMPFPFSLSK
jgi:TonB family protein